MVKVRDDFPLTEDGAIDVDAWLARINVRREPAQMRLLCAAIELVITQHWDAVTDLKLSCFEQGLAMAEILGSLNMDTQTLVACVVYPSVQFGELALDTVEEKLGKPIAKLVGGAIRMDAIRSLQSTRNEGRLSSTQGDNLRKMLIAMVDDTRTVLIKLAERIHLLRAVKTRDPELQQRMAQETRDVFAPLANRLGIGQLKWELEDLAFRYLEADAYKQIATGLHEKRTDRERWIKNVIAELQAQMDAIGIKAEVTGRVKHLYSIWKKMVRKHVGLDEIYDVRAVRILVPEIKDCYAALGIVHGTWAHIPKEFDDYVATPKENGYRSLHTAVVGPEGRVLEVQIRTYDMHQESELGVAAHWRYKEGTSGAGGDTQESKIAWLRQLVEWQEEVADSSDLLAQFRHEVVEERVYVFAPDGAIVDLPSGATPVDFAYNIHTTLGHRCRGAKVNGRIVPLNYKLKTGELVQILPAKEGAPSRDWLNPHLGFVHSQRARTKIQQFFRLQNREQNIAEGREVLDRELARNGLSKIDLLPVAQKFNQTSVDDLYAGVGSGDYGVVQVTNAALAMHMPQPEERPEYLPVVRPQVQRLQGDVSVRGVDNLMTHTAGCCRPVPGDAVIGYVTQGRGVAIHRQDCVHIGRAREERAERLIEVDWSSTTASLYVVDLQVEAVDRQGLLRDITSVVANERVNVVGLTTTVNKRTNVTLVLLQVEVRGSESIGRLVTQLGKVSNVLLVKRKE